MAGSLSDARVLALPVERADVVLRTMRPRALDRHVAAEIDAWPSSGAVIAARRGERAARMDRR
ncbi:MAG: hypothetical protein IT561_09210 [Alphaproteobacteria bacterium]|nr:hypothetical protein [Alphaproteobacteria bacterium]